MAINLQKGQRISLEKEARRASGRAFHDLSPAIRPYQ